LVGVQNGDDLVGERKALSDVRGSLLGVHIYATPLQMQEHAQGPMHKVVLKRIGVHTVSGMAEDAVIFHWGAIALLDVML
jgi:hypothetical protein